jgi:hypothetical protein
MKLENAKRDKNGKFIPLYKVWNLKHFNEGYINSNGRFVVRVPNHHRANSNGWIIRSIVAYEAFHPSEKVTKEYVVHHKDENRLNDSKKNLEKILFGEHTRIHWSGKSREGQNEYLKTGKYLKCPTCGKIFYRAKGALIAINYCSRSCYYISKRSPLVERKCPWCKKIFIISEHRDQECCSKSCSAKLKGFGKGPKK